MKDVNIIKISENDVNGGIYAFFSVGDKEYYADIAFVPYIGSECMIFESKDGSVTSWGDLYCARNISITEDALRKCINEFAESL